MLFDTHDDIIVSMSGGKDSTVLFNLALMVAREKGRLPLKVFWLDQEAEWQHTVDYMDYIMRLPEVEPYWYQVPFAFPNNLSQQNKTLIVWDDSVKDKWIHPLSDIGIHESQVDVSNVGRDDAFYVLIENLPKKITKSDNCAVLVGLRMVESQRRRMTIAYGNARFRGVTWCQKKHDNIQVFWPIYDFTNSDIWTAIAKNHWKYNEVYDLQYRWGIREGNMRVSALIHETAWHWIECLQEFEPLTYNLFLARMAGVGTFSHSFDYGEILPKKLPFVFQSWLEYRNYLLNTIIPKEDIGIYMSRWKNQEGDNWYRVHVKELILNDTCGTLNANAKASFDLKRRLEQKKYRKRDIHQFNEYMKGKQDGD